MRHLPHLEDPLRNACFGSLILNVKRIQLGAMFIFTYGGYSRSFFLFESGLQRKAVGLNFL